MKSTIHDVAKRAGVSMKTVSRVLNHEPNVANETRKKVMIAATELRYSPSLAARSLASSKTYLIALLYDNPSPNYIANIQKGATKACREHGYHLVAEPLDITGSAAANAGDISIDVERALERLPVDGAILTPPLCDNGSVIHALQRLKIPYVPVAPSTSHGGVAIVQMDDVKASKEMTQYLISLGHKKIAFIKGDPYHSATPRRFEGFRAAMRKADLDIRADYVQTGDYHYRSGVAAAETLLGLAEPPTAIFASNDDMAAGVISVANRLGVAVPEALSVGGFDDTPLARILWPQLTTVRQPIEGLGFEAVKLLISKEKKHGVLQTLDHDLIVRGSSGPHEASG